MSLWSRDEVTVLIEEYRKWPNLYKIKFINYKNRNLKRQALESILTVLKDIKPNVTIQEIQSKFQSLKQNATKELKKCIFKKSESGGEETAKPSLWYYRSISYVFDNNLPRESTDSLDMDTFDEQMDAEELEAQDETTDNEIMLSGVVSPEGTIVEDLDQRSVSRASSAVERAPVSKNKRQKKNEDIVLGKVSETLDTIT